ncbi:MAG: ATP-binding cassette domain-containing protein [Firmicutes bacterium]|nr:ATP-binding cassette domain-containing protein [Bacillota bacterium]
MSLLEVTRLAKFYPAGNRLFARSGESIRAVDGVSFTLERGETLGLVGESGCGKSTLGRLVLCLEEPTAGKIILAGQDITRLPDNQMRKLRRKMQIIFQDSYSSLNPRQTVGSIISEPMENYRVASKQGIRLKVEEMLATVGLEPDIASLYPHEFSGGQRQRINIARALALRPEIVVCDEPVSSLDVSIQAQILNLLKELKQSLGLSYIFISHDLAAVSYISDRVAVMYMGKLVEVLSCRDLEKKARHPYTRALLAAVPRAEPRRRAQVAVRGEAPDPLNPPTGCRFHPRCPIAAEKCRTEEPLLSGTIHLVACHFALGEDHSHGVALGGYNRSKLR